MKNKITSWITVMILTIVFINIILFGVLALLAFGSWDIKPITVVYGSWGDYFGLFRFTVIIGVILGSYIQTTAD